ncbi:MULTISPECIES: AzlD family protein [unclassified Paraburkholderia]|uniref:AzlD family protein n=1 Tax=unclassified Paraburkholderia TaxID=2615204 RepID=UPI00197F121E|nr:MULTISPECIES: AzlD family protein [unclassified Paraburkholderia]MBN3857880.1 AzlD family protein [Paraburkholderia sp. Ac-20340]
MLEGSTLATLATIFLMAATTYLTRIIGYVALRDRTLSPRMRAVMENVPGCVLISVIAPAFVSRDPADLVALAITLFAATRFSLLPTVLIGVAATGILRHLLG